MMRRWSSSTTRTGSVEWSRRAFGAALMVGAIALPMFLLPPPCWEQCQIDSTCADACCEQGGADGCAGGQQFDIGTCGPPVGTLAAPTTGPDTPQPKDQREGVVGSDFSFEGSDVMAPCGSEIFATGGKTIDLFILHTSFLL